MATCDSLLQDSDAVTVINIHNLTRNFVLYCACPPNKKSDFGHLIGGGRSFDWWRAGRLKGSKYLKIVGKLSGPPEI